MRINIYNEELTERVELTEKRAANTGVSFYGLHFYLHSPEELHHDDADDDSSAVIFWGDTPEKLLSLLSNATQEVQMLIKSR